MNYRKKHRTAGYLMDAVLVVLLMPFAGLYLMSREDSAASMYGKVLFVLGGLSWTMFWIVKTAGMV